VLLTDPSNYKTHYRMALVYKELQDYERAAVSIKKARSLSQSQDIINQYAEINALLK